MPESSIITIVNKADYVAVYDGFTCVNFGNRPVDHTFAKRVNDKLVSEGYTPVSYGEETHFTKINPTE